MANKSTPSLAQRQAYAASKGKYYSSSDGKTYANYNDALAARNSRVISNTPVNKLFPYRDGRYKNPDSFTKYNAALRAFKAGGGVEAAVPISQKIDAIQRVQPNQSSFPKVRDVGRQSQSSRDISILALQRRGQEALRARQNTPNTAVGFDQAFASARKLGDKTFKWRGGTYTTQMAHTDLLDLVKGYLLAEGYADCLGSAEIILENMSDIWFDSIVDVL